MLNYVEDLTLEWHFSDKDNLVLPLESLLRESNMHKGHCDLLITNLGQHSDQIVLGSAIFQQFSMHFMPMGNTEHSEKPFVVIQQQIGAMPGSSVVSQESDLQWITWLMVFISLSIGLVALVWMGLSLVKKNEKKRTDLQAVVGHPSDYD